MNLLITPRVSEKSYDLVNKRNTYVFVVPLSTNKIEVKKAVQADYKVEVIKVNIASIDGKRKRSYLKGGKKIIGNRSDIKKAYVTLKEGQTIPVFASKEEETK